MFQRDKVIAFADI